LAAVLRMAAPVANWPVALTSLAGLAWSAAFALFVFHYGPMLVRLR
jgi:uncharacterized protein involved in response to NO